MLKAFRLVGYLEGTSFLLLLGVAMPLKYLWGQPQAVRWVGSAHGGLFVAYVVLAALVASDRGWPLRKTGAAFLAAVLPLGTFVFDRQLAADSQH